MPEPRGIPTPSRNTTQDATAGEPPEIRSFAPKTGRPRKIEATCIHTGGRMNQKEADMADTFYSIRQVADRLGVRWYRLKYAHQAGHVQEPMRVGNTRFYADADIRRLEDYFSIKGGDNEARVPHQRSDLPGLAEPEGLCVRDDQRGRPGQGLPPAPAGLGSAERSGAGRP